MKLKNTRICSKMILLLTLTTLFLPNSVFSGNNCGGFIGYEPGDVWLAGTDYGGYPGLLLLLPDTGRWKRFTIVFSGPTTIALKLEDWGGSGGVPGDAYFDNILLTDGAQTLFFDDFESGLGKWETVGSGVIVSDPLKPNNHALSFAELHSGGDIFSKLNIVSGSYILSFDYLGTCNGPSTSSNLFLPLILSH